jgi:hypothetical protein
MIEACGNGLWFFSRSAASDRRDRSVRAPRSVKGDEAPASDLAPLLQQREEQFAYNVCAHVLDRTADANRFLDSLFFAWTAAQTAIYAIVVDKVKDHPLVAEVLVGGLVLALLGTGLTLFVGEGPDPDEFAADFPDDPEGTRRQYIDDYIRKANRNERLRIVKTVMLILSLALTVIPLLIATATRTSRV